MAEGPGMKRRLMGGFALVLSALVFSNSMASAGLDGPTCVPQHVQWGSMYANIVYSVPPSYNCEMLGQHGTYGTAAYAQVWMQAEAQYTPQDCTYGTTRAFYGCSGTICQAGIQFVYSNGDFAQSTGPNPSGIWSSRFAANVPGYGTMTRDVGVAGLNC